MKKNILTLALIYAIIGNFVEITYAQSSIQTPEAASFEPFDAGNMVDLITGDFSYSIPLLSVPSNSGEFPISMFYHAGVGEYADASWVGLGWNINPGAINRTLNVIPDDWNGKKIGSFYFQDGIEKKVTGLDLNIMRFGVGYNWGYSKSLYNYNAISQLSLSLSFNTPGIDGNMQSAGVGISIGTEGADINYNFGFGLESEGLKDFGLGIGFGTSGVSASFRENSRESFGSAGISLSASYSGGIGIGNGFGGFSTARGQTSAADLRLKNEGGLYLHVGIPGFFEISFDKQRYSGYFFSNSKRYGYGILYGENAFNLMQNLNTEFNELEPNIILDSYSNPFDVSIYADPLENILQNSLSFAGYDGYTVNAQGLSGSMSPFIGDINSIFRDATIVKYGTDENPELEEAYSYLLLSGTNNFNIDKTFFQFNGERSGYRSVTFDNLNFTENDVNFMNGIDITGKSITNAIEGTVYNSANNRHGSGKYVEWFTNNEIRAEDAKNIGFIEDEIAYTLRREADIDIYHENYDPEGIGGYMITSEDGKTYHFSIPVYNYETFNAAEAFGGKELSIELQPHKYAYAFLLTAITGPDYYDKNQNGRADEEDFGFWVKFSYGKWSDGYLWRSPYDRNEMQKDDIHSNYSFGRKQLYYLNSAETSTHIAYFIKDLREDGLGYYDISLSANLDAEYVDSPTTVDLTDCGFPTLTTITYQGELQLEYDLDERVHPMKLHKIILLDKRDDIIKNSQPYEPLIASMSGFFNYDELANLSGTYTVYGGGTGSVGQCVLDTLKANFSNNLGIAEREFGLYYPNNVIDVKDLSTSQWSQLEAKALNVIEFEQDYSLCQGNPTTTEATGGTLTLLSLKQMAQGGRDIFPPTNFTYYQLGDNSQTSFDADNWGFDKTYPHNWSLKEIEFPLGARIAIEYAADDYSKEAIFNGIPQKLNSTSNSAEWFGASDIIVTGTIPDGLTYDDVFSQDIKYKTKIGITYEYEEPVMELNGPTCYDEGSNIERTKSRNLNEYLQIDEVPGQPTNFSLTIAHKITSQICTQQTISVNNLEVYGIRDNWIKTGGGLRVEKIEVINPDGASTSQKYHYNIPGTSSSSGITVVSTDSYKDELFVPYMNELPAPGVLYQYVMVESADNEDNTMSKIQYYFITPSSTENIQGSQLKLKANYNNTEILSVVDDVDPNTSLGTGDLEVSYPFYYDKDFKKTSDYEVFYRKSSIINNLALIGSLRSVKTFNSADDLIAESEYNYDINSVWPGYSSQTFVDTRRHTFLKDCPPTTCFPILDNRCRYPCAGTDDDIFITFTSKSVNPVRLSSVVNKTGNSITRNFSEDYDPVSGIALTSRLILPNGVETKVKSIPAYTISSYSQMGSKALNDNNKNMLTQSAATYSYTQIDDIERVIGASIQTWNNQWDNTYLDLNTSGSEFEYNGVDPAAADIWRKHKTFLWAGDMTEDGAYSDLEGEGTSPDGDFYVYTNLNNLKTNWNTYFGDNDYDKWMKSSEVSRYNHFSNVVEAKDINEDFASSKKDFRQLNTISSGVNANFVSYTATSFEESELLPDGVTVHYGGEVIGSNSNSAHYLSHIAPDDGLSTKIYQINAHTGDYYLKINANQHGPHYKVDETMGLLTGQEYRASVWMHKANVLGSLCVKINNGTPIEAHKASGTQFGDWVLVNLDFDVPAGASIEVYPRAGSSDVSYFDDFRVGPKNAAISSYTYDRAGNVTAILNADNFATRYYYDAAGRLIKTEYETENGFAKAATHEYNYAGRFSVSPITEQVVPFEGTGFQELEFGVNKEGTTLNFTHPEWMDVLSVTSDRFLVSLEPNTFCGDIRTAELVVTGTDPSVGEVRIPFTQLAAPAYSNIHITDQSQAELSNNELREGSTYWVEFDHCEQLNTRALDLVVCEFRNNEIWRRVDYIRSGLFEYSSPTGTYPCQWNLSTAGSTGLEWNSGADYRIVLEDHTTQELMVASDKLIIKPAEASGGTIQMLEFIKPPNGPVSPLNPTQSGSYLRYEMELEWYTNNWKYNNLAFVLEIYGTGGYPYLGEIYLPGEYQDEWIMVDPEMGKKTWIFYSTHIEDAINNLFSGQTSKQLGPANPYYYMIRVGEFQNTSDPCPTTECPSTSTGYFQINGLEFAWY